MISKSMNKRIKVQQEEQIKKIQSLKKEINSLFEIEYESLKEPMMEMYLSGYIMGFKRGLDAIE